MNGICHRDLKPDNIIVTKDLSDLRIIDFNVSVNLKNGAKTRGVTGSKEFQPYEMHHG